MMTIWSWSWGTMVVFFFTTYGLKIIIMMKATCIRDFVFIYYKQFTQILIVIKVPATPQGKSGYKKDA